MRFLLQSILAILARGVLRRYRPDVIAITGSVGKTSVKDAVACVLSAHFAVRATPRNLNTEFGLPMTVIGGPYCTIRSSFGKMLLRCVRLFGRALHLLLFRSASYPSILVLEMGAAKPGDIRHLVGIARPTVALLTAIESAHVEGFGTREAIEKEKKEIYAHLTEKNWIVANLERPETLPQKSSARIRSFSCVKNARAGSADITISKISERLTFLSSRTDVGVSFDVSYCRTTERFDVDGVLGRHWAELFGYAIAVGTLYDIPLASMNAALQNFCGPRSRMRPLPGIKKTLLIDDTYNSSPVAVALALSTLERFEIDPGARRWAVLGDLFEMGSESESAHREMGAAVAASGADFFVAVGPLSRASADAAGLDEKRIFRFDDPVSAGSALKEKIKKGDIILVKGSQGARMEKCVIALMAEPERAAELVVRQTPEWN
ncbi:MAG: UDP-N-acetylmuramoyl-tripeptide--D-alanyl-D-alanine ligase [Patescibacteria group bacterium]